MLYLKRNYTELTKILVPFYQNKISSNLHRPEVAAEQHANDIIFAQDIFDHFAKFNNILGVTFPEVINYNGLKHKSAGNLSPWDVEEVLTILVRLKKEKLEQEQRDQQMLSEMALGLY